MTTNTIPKMAAPRFCHHSNRVSRPIWSRTVAKIITLAVLLLLNSVWASAQGTLAPVPQQVFLDNSGNPLNGGLVYTYLAGTTTATTTWSDQGLTTTHANPIVLNSAGRPTAGGIYLSTSVLYKFIVKTSAGVTIYTQDNISPNLAASVASSDNATCGGRITLTSATPITTSDVAAATTVYYTPYQGNRCSLYDGSSTWTISSFSELSLSLGTDAANTNYDLFLYLSSGAPTLERVAWTNGTTRATNLASQNGVLVKSSDTTHRYLGTYRTTATIGQTQDSVGKRFVWNYMHRVRRVLRVTEATDSWTYTTATFRQANANTANQVAVVVGVAEFAQVSLALMGYAANSGTSLIVGVAIGVDSTTTASVGSVGMASSTGAAGVSGPIAARLDTHSPVGYHEFTWLEISTASGTTTWYGDAGSPGNLQSGLTGTIEG